MKWSQVIGSAALLPLLAASIRLTVPIAVAAAGECVTEKSGVLNLGVEGMMLGGALAAFMATYYSHQSAVGALAGIGAGVALAVFMAILVIRFKVDQVIVGVTLVILSGGLTSYLYLQQFGVTTTPPQLPVLKSTAIPLLHDIPGMGYVLFNQSGLVYVGLVLPFALWWLLNRTRFGLSVRAAGERPDAADANAVHVERIRWISLLIGGAMAGLGGAILVIADVSLFRDNITAGRGWIAVAMVIVARWNPIGALAGSFIFGFTDALQLRIQAAGGGFGAGFPYEFFQALPYLVPLVIVVVTTVRAKRTAQPSALGVPLEKGASH